MCAVSMRKHSVFRLRRCAAAPAGAAAAGVGMVPRAGGFSRRRMLNPGLAAPWLSEADIDFYAGEFARTGFRGGLNWYRNIDRNWELLAPFAGAAVTVPALYMAGDLRPRRCLSAG